jgi:hypothetical protein
MLERGKNRSADTPSGVDRPLSIEVILDMDAHGIIRVRAREIGAGGQQGNGVQPDGEMSKE